MINNSNINHYSTADKTFIQLCDEVDFWKEKYEDMKQQRDEANKMLAENLNQQIEGQKETLGLLFQVVFNSEQTEEGILIRQQ